MTDHLTLAVSGIYLGVLIAVHQIIMQKLREIEGEVRRGNQERRNRARYSRPLLNEEDELAQ